MTPVGLPGYESSLLVLCKVKLKPNATVGWLTLLSQHATFAIPVSAQHRAMPIFSVLFPFLATGRCRNNSLNLVTIILLYILFRLIFTHRPIVGKYILVDFR